MEKKTILIELDGVMADVKDGKAKAVIADTSEALKELRKAGYKIHVFSRSIAAREDVEEFLKESGIEYDRVVTLAPFDIIVSNDSVQARSRWEWTLENIVLHRPTLKKDTQKEMHKAMQRYKEIAKRADESHCVSL